MNSPTLKALEKVFNISMEAHKFVEIERDEPNIMDSGYIIYQREGLFIRLVSDRGRHSIEIGNLTFRPEWFDLTLLRNFIENRDVLTIASPEELSIFVKDSFLILSNMFTNNIADTIELIQQLQKERVIRMFPNVKI